MAAAGPRPTRTSAFIRCPTSTSPPRRASGSTPCSGSISAPVPPCAKPPHQLRERTRPVPPGQVPGAAMVSRRCSGNCIALMSKPADSADRAASRYTVRSLSARALHRS
jgi:hypothetical protein